MLVAFTIGTSAGVVTMKDEEFGIGDSHRAQEVLVRELPTERAAEQVLIQSRSGRLTRAELRSAIDDLVGRLSRVPVVAAIKSPLDTGNAGQVSADGRSALVTFQITGDPDTAQDRLAPVLAATAAVQRAHGGVTDWLPLERAVDYGIRATANVVTSAAIVMVGVFAIFATLGLIDFKMMGVGLAVAVLLDATIVRAVLLPATMTLLGEWNWYLPRWLEWLPRVTPEEHATPAEAERGPRTPVGV